MADRELLKAAAKAVNGGAWHPLTHDTPNGTWNPLTDDGDALRLAVRLRIDIAHFTTGVRADVTGYDDCYQANDADPYAATRRAIVRAATKLATVAPAVGSFPRKQ